MDVDVFIDRVQTAWMYIMRKAEARVRQLLGVSGVACCWWLSDSLMQRAARKDFVASIIIKSKGRGTPVAGCHGEAQLRCQQPGAWWLGD